MSYIGKAPANSALTADDITDGIIGADKLATNSVTTVKVSNANITSAKLASGVLPTNTPAFEAVLSSDQAVSDNTLTKVAFNSEAFDTDNKFTDARFTPTIAGKYFVYSQVNGFAGGDSDLITMTLQIRKNGSVTRFSFIETSNNFGKTHTLNCSSILTLDSDDYVEIFASIDGNSNGGEVIQGTTNSASIFGAYKLIGA